VEWILNCNILKLKDRNFDLAYFEKTNCCEWTNLHGFMNGQSIVDFQKPSRFKEPFFFIHNLK
jgi:hypothetical protein